MQTLNILKLQDRFKSQKNNLVTNNMKNGSILQKKTDENKKYEFLNESHLELLDLNKNVENLLPKVTKPLINLESVCKFTSQIEKREQKSKDVKHLYELGSPQIVGTYIQPRNDSMQTLNNFQNNLTKSFSTIASTNVSLPPSPFFHPPSSHFNATNSFLPINLNKNVFGISTCNISTNAPTNLTVTTIPNKDKDILEKEAKQLKLLLNNSSKGVVNANPDYQIIYPSFHSNNIEDNINTNDKKSDFSFGKQENTEYAYEYICENNYSPLPTNDQIYKNEKYTHEDTIEYINQDSTYIETKEQSETEEIPKSDSIIKNRINEKEKQTTKKNTKNQIQSQKKPYNSSKTYEPSICFKNSKKYVNIRLGRPKYPYITNSSDPIDKKLRDWHNTHNSQIKWKKIRRGIYSFGKTEIVLTLVHDKILVKKIDGIVVKDNLLTVEKFVSLNELNELQREEN